MSLSNLATTFRNQAAANNGNITINAATFSTALLTPPEGLDALLAKGYQLPEGAFLLLDTTGTSIQDPIGNTLTIKQATAAMLQVDKTNTSVMLVVKANETGAVQITIQIDLSNWKFSTSWQYMTGGIFDNIPYTAPSFIFSTEDAPDFSWQNQSVALVKGQNFAALITLTQWLQPVANFFTSWNTGTKLALLGSLDPSMVNNEDIIYPEMNLYVSINATLISLGFLKVSDPGIGFQIKTIEEVITEEEEQESDEELATDVEIMELIEETEKTQTPILYFQLTLQAGDHIAMDFSAAIIAETVAFDITVTSDPTKPLTPLNLFSLMAGNNWFTIIPPTLQQYLNSIAFKGFTTSLDFTNGLEINSVSAFVGSNGAWKLFDNFIIEEFDVNWLIIGPATTNLQTLFLTARVNFFPTIFQGGFDVEITSDLTLSASFNGRVLFNDLLAAITGGFIKIPESLVSVVFTGFGIDMDINQKYYAFYANGDVALDLITNISLTDASLQLTSTSTVSSTGSSVYTAAISGLFTIGNLMLQSTVQYNSSTQEGGWKLSVKMPQGNKLNLGELVDGLFKKVGFELPTSFLPADLSVINFELTADIPNGTEKGSYTVKTSIEWIFTFPILNQRIDIIAALALQYDAKKPEGKQYAGGVMGNILLEYFNAEVTIGYSFDGDDQLLMIEWEGFIAKYDVTGQSKSIIFEIKNWSLGSLLTSFMKMLFDPNFELDAPWDVLNKISLDGFKVTYDLDTKEVVVDYKLPKSLNLVFITIDGVRLTKNTNGVQIAFDGSSLVPAVNDSNLFNKEKGQDVKSMPDVPGQGSQYFDLRLLAMGQHVELNNAAEYQSIKAVTDAMADAFEIPEKGRLPIGPGSGNSLLTFNENSNWLVATDFGILNVGSKEKPIWTMEMQVVFNDPNLYGLRIAMAGDKAKIFAGLDFEIMYKKIADGVGVYQIALTLPYALRYLQFGAVNITLPSIGLAIYTNGDFMVDVGFPYNLDFSRSFTIQAIVPPGIPAMGSGGFYFGKLSSVTTKKVPQTNYGDFNPVIVFGIGMQLGVGYSIHYGVLDAGFSVTIFGILEGVIATYHPYQGLLQENNKTEVETSYYYWLQGTLGIIGKLYGSLNFGIISANVNIVVKVYAQATLEAYNKMPLAIVATVDVQVSAKLNLGIFSIKINFSFKAEIRTDLTIGTDQTAMAPWNRQLSDSFDQREMDYLAKSSQRLILPVKRMHYNSKLVALETEEKPTLNIYFIPHLTISGSSRGDLSDQSAQYVTTLWIDTPDSDNLGATSISSFEYLSQDFFRWLIQNYVDEVGRENTRDAADELAVSEEDLQVLLTLLSNEDTPLPIPTDKLLTFFQDTFEAVNIQNVTEASKLEAAAVFPMFFDLELSVPDAGITVDFSNYSMATDAYLSQVKKWFDELAVKVSEEQHNNAALKNDATSVEHSLATFVFEDYFVLIGKQLIGYAGDALKNYTYPLANGDSLKSMTNWANSKHTTSGVTNKVAITELAKANQSHPLASETPILITGVLYTVLADDNFVSIGAKYALETVLLISQNALAPGLLQVQEITFKSNTYTVRLTDSISDVAIGLQTTVSELANDEVFQKNAKLTTGAIFIIAAASYTAKNEETFSSIATVVYNGLSVSALLLQNQKVPGLFITGKSFTYETIEYEIVPGDTLSSIAQKLSTPTNTVTVDELANDSVVQKLPVQPLGNLLIQPFFYTARAFDNADEADTLGKIAQKYSTTAEMLGANYANQEQSNLFYLSGDYSTANIPGLSCLDVESILNYFKANKLYTQLAGMVSRYQLHGMRLPTALPGLTLNAGSSCTEDDCALYRLTGQQFEVPATVQEGFAINLINNTLDWLQFNGEAPAGNPKTAILPVILTKEDIGQISTVIDYAQQTGIEPDILKLAPMTPYNLVPVQYTFQTVTKWTTSGMVKLPYGNLGDQTDVSPLIWNFPSGLLQQISLIKRAGSTFDMQVGTYNAANGKMDYKNAAYYGWSTCLEIDIKKQSDDRSPGTDAFTYELIGASASGTQILERLLRELDPNSTNNNQAVIEDIQWLYDGGQGLASVGNINMKTFIVQSNLSTETNPVSATAALFKQTTEPAETNGVLNTLYDFIKLLWECSVTKSGGYYLLYNERESNAGFPNTIFDNADHAQISLLITYNNVYNNILKDFMNCAVTGDKIDTSASVVYAASKARYGLNYTTINANETLESIAAQYNILISELAQLNETDVKLSTSSKTITLIGLQYEVGLSSDTPSNSLAAIANYFNVVEEEVEKLNPDISAWDNLPVWQLIALPTINYQISAAGGTPGNTMKSIAAYYFTDVDTLSFMIKDDALFEAGISFHIVDQVVHKVSSIQQGTAGFELKRTDPGMAPDKPSEANYATVYLNNLYNLLNYQVVANRYFNNSIVGLPSGPANTSEEEETNIDNEWTYNQVIPIAQYAIENPNMAYPVGYPQAEDNPYRGIGHILQIHFDWVDYYGNETVTPFSNPKLNTKSPLNNPPIQVGYLDELKGLSQWPSLFITYDVSSNNVAPQLQLNFSFDISRYQNSDDGSTVSDLNDPAAPDYQKNALHDLAIYTAIYYQINQYSPYKKDQNTITLTLRTSLLPGKEIPVSLDPINAFVKAIYSYLYSIAYATDNIAAPVMEPIDQPITLADLETASIFELTVDLTLKRDLSFVNDDFKDSPSVISARTSIQANTSTSADGAKNNAGEAIQNHSLTAFAVHFEKTFYQKDEYLLKIATGVNEALAGSQHSQAIYIVRMGLKPGNGIYWKVASSASYELTTDSITKLIASNVPNVVTDKLKKLVGVVYANRSNFDAALHETLNEEEFNAYQVQIYTYSLLNAAFYAPLPISTSLTSKKDVPVCRYVTGKGLDCENDTVRNFTDIDMDIWGKQCLEAIDLFLNAEFAVPGFLVDQLKAEEEQAFLQEQGIEAKSFLEAITNAKSLLAETISTRVTPILTAPEVSPTAVLSAQEKFKQQLLIKLGNADSINAVVQMQVTAESGIKQEDQYQVAPRLYGTPGITNGQEEDSQLYSISNAKIQLGFEEQQQITDLSFIFSTKNTKEFTTVSLDMDYQVTHIEFDINDVPDVKGYQTSRWLTFIVPVNLAEAADPNFDKSALQQSLGTVDIPIVLRNYPKPPSLTTQTGIAVPINGDSTREILEKASAWDFSYVYAEDQAAQDQIYADITFNIFDSKQNSAMLKNDSRNLFNDMAQMISVWDPVLNDMIKYLRRIAPASDENDPNLNNAFYAMQAMVEVSHKLALAWDQHNKTTALLQSGQNGTSAYDFIIQQKEDPHFTTTCPCKGNETCKRLVVTIIPPQEMSELDKKLFMEELIMQEAPIPNTPVINIKGYYHVPATDESGTTIENSYWFVKNTENNAEVSPKDYLGYPCSFEIPDRSVEVKGLNVLQFQNAWAGIAVIRNEGLVKDNPTNSGFIYRTPLIRFSNGLVPLLSNSEEINIAQIEQESGNVLSLANHLAVFFKTFFTNDQLKEQVIKIGSSWNYYLQNKSESTLPAIQLPVVLCTPFAFKIPADYEIPEEGCPSEITATTPFVCQLATTLEQWYQENMPVTTDAYFSFDVSVFSSVTETQLPLIQLSNLILPYKYIKRL